MNAAREREPGRESESHTKGCGQTERENNVRGACVLGLPNENRGCNESTSRARNYLPRQIGGSGSEEEARSDRGIEQGRDGRRENLGIAYIATIFRVRANHMGYFRLTVEDLSWMVRLMSLFTVTRTVD